MHLLHLILKPFIALAAIKAAAAAESPNPPKPDTTPIYIDRVPGYEALESCAVYPLSTIVRNMWRGCGDGSKLTSYACFCTSSYSKFSWQISTAVAENCGSAQETLATSAVDVFHSYCTYGSQQLTDSRYAVAAATTSEVSTITSTATVPSQTGASLPVKADSSSGGRITPLPSIVFTSSLIVSLGYRFIM